MADISAAAGAMADYRTTREKWPQRLLSCLFTSVAVSVTIGCLGILQLVLIFRAGVVRLQKTPFLRWIARWPVAGLLAAPALALALSTDAVRAWGSNSAAAAVVVVLAWLAVFAVRVLSWVRIELYPPSLAEIERRARRRWPERFFAAHMRHPIDAYFVRDMIYLSLIMGTAWIVLLAANFLPEMNYLFFGMALLAAYGKYEVFDHKNLHNRMFRCRRDATRPVRIIFRLTDFYVEYILSLIGLRLPHFNKIQHNYVHHFENNGINDTNSTLFYDRLSFVDFCRFATVFALDYATANRTSAYLRRRHLHRALNRVIRGSVVFYGALAALFLVNPAAAVFVWCVKFLLQVSAAVTGYAWHAFADPEDPQNAFHNAIDIVVLDGHSALGDGPHIHHHQHPGLHWSKSAAVVARDAHEGEAQGALRWYNYTGPFYSFRSIVKALWSDRLDTLEPLFASYGKAIPDRDALIEVLRARTRPISTRSRSATARRIDRWLGTIMAKYLIADPLPPSNYRALLPRRRRRLSATDVRSTELP